jgi:PKD repeat protein
VSARRLVAGVATTAVVTAAALVGSGGVRVASAPVVPASSVAAQAAATEGSVRFTASGDFSTTAAAMSVFSAIGALHPDLHLALGDLSYSTTLDEQGWCDLVTARVGPGFPFELLAGNHESNGMNGSINDFSACLPNQLPGLVGTYGRQYSVDVPAEAPLVRYIMISPALEFPDGTWSYAAGTPRYAWTSAAIDDARADGVPWVVVGMHKPCLSMGAYNCDPGADLIDLLVDKRVDLVLHGHEHLYQRSHQLATSAACPALVPGSYSAACVADTDATMTKGAGTVFATVGTGGTPFRDINLSDSESRYFAAYSALNADPTWGSLDVTATATQLTAGFSRASGGTFTDTFTLGPPTTPTNQPPTSSFSAACTGLTCTMDAAASTDPDGTIAAYAWGLGDGSTATAVTASHTYASAGSYTVTLTVTDDDGASSSTTRVVTVTDGSQPLARDDFARSVATGWGTAPTGGPWTIAGNTANLQVTTGAGVMTLAPGSTRGATLGSLSSTSTDSTVTVALDRVPGGSGGYATVIGRQVGAAAYSASAWVRSTGAVSLVLKQGSTALSVVAVPGLVYTPGAELMLRAQVTGTAPTTLRAKLWPKGQPEPAAWTLSTTDATAALQAAGSAGLQAYLSSTAGASTATRFDDYGVRPGP